MGERTQNAIAQTNSVTGCLKKRGDRQSEKPSDKILQWFAIFHDWDFITAVATNGKPAWTTRSNFPLNPETLYARWASHDELVGVRFSTSHGGETQYLMLDIDIGSQYHPLANEQEFSSVLSALEMIGLCRRIIIRSSNSGGLHVYFPLPKPFSCYKLALAVQQALQQAGIVVMLGQLEIFPNVRASSRSLYSAHRLPLQIGSFVLNDDFHVAHSQIDRLIDTWRTLATQQDSDQLEQVVAIARSFKCLSSGSTQEWRERLESTLICGWTGSKQTNQVVKEVCIYVRVFQGLSWDEVESWVLAKIVTLPGYQQFCRHRREIRRRVKDWVKTNRHSGRYHPYGSQTKQPKQPKAPPNSVRSREALERIKAAISTIKATLGDLPPGAKKRQNLICNMAQCSATTLRKHLELWHPKFENQECITPCYVGLSGILDEQFETPKEEEDSRGCVTSFSVKVSAISEINADHGAMAERLPRKGVTHSPLLSVNSVSCSYRSGDAALSNDLPELASVPVTISPQITECSQQYSLKTQQQPAFEQQVENKAPSISSICRNDIVRRKSDQALFRVQRVNANATLWAKWLNQLVPLVDVVLHISEIELLKQCA
jgi:hypothetical protein